MTYSLRQQEGIKTYGALLIPLEKTNDDKDTVKIDPKEVTKQEGKIKSAIKRAGSAVKNNISKFNQSIGKSVSDLVTYMKDENNSVNDKIGKIGSKFSGIAITQMIIDGKVSNKSSRDYLFLGFAPQLGVAGVEFGYSGLKQMKNAIANGDINVGQFLSGFKKAVKGATDLKNQIKGKEISESFQVVEFDLTNSHSENYISETPDRRVQDGISYSEVIHNLPETFEVQCSLQDGKRYTTSEFREIITNLRNSKKLVTLVLGDEQFSDLVLTGFNPSSDCSKSGFDYSLSFKKISVGSIRVDAEVEIQQLPTLEGDSTTLTTGSLSIGGTNASMPDVAGDIQKMSKEIIKNIDLKKSVLYQAVNGAKDQQKSTKGK